MLSCCEKCHFSLMVVMANNGSTSSAKNVFLITVMQVLASKTKIYMVLEYVTGGELFDRIVRDLLALSSDFQSYFHFTLLTLLSPDTGI